MSQPSQLTPADQDALVKQIGISLMQTAPQEWQQIRTEYRAAGRYYELTAEIIDESGQSQAWAASHEVAMLFAKLRAGTHAERGGTWFNARYQIQRPSKYNLEFDRSEPRWRTPPPIAAYRDELLFFPRSEDDVPEWLMRRLSGLRPEQPGRRFRIARIFDGRGPSGRPSVNRPPVEGNEKELLLEYLDRSPMILPERGHDIDRLSPEAGQTVPVAFYCDGTWIWPAAVNYYLRHYGLPPEVALTEHARANNFEPRDIDEGTASEAAANITGARPPGPPRPPAEQAPRPPQGPPPVEPAGAATAEVAAPEPNMPPAPPAQPPPPVAPRAAEAIRHHPAVLRVPGSDPDVALEQLRRRLDELGVPESVYRIGEPVPNVWYLEQVEDGWQVGWHEGEFSAPMLFDEADDAAAFLLGKLLLEDQEPGGRHSGAEHTEAELEPVPPPPELPERSLSLVASEEPLFEPGPKVSVPEQQNRVNGATTYFDALAAERTGLHSATPDPTDGGVPNGHHTFDPQDEDDIAADVEDELADEPPLLSGGSGPDPLVRGADRTEGQHGRQESPLASEDGTVSTAEEPAPPQWPIQPLRGEPPLTLFRHKRMEHLPAGTEIDRFGDELGNLTYDSGTPFEERSLVPEWVNRPYHVYQVQRPIEVLIGVAIPWFDQPGGGTAYLLSSAVEDLLRCGDLVEVDTDEHP
ncbi:MAG: TNT domain-containing protein [Sciscionella sp.]